MPNFHFGCINTIIKITGGDKMKKLCLVIFLLSSFFVWILTPLRVGAINNQIYFDEGRLFNEVLEAFDVTVDDFDFTEEELSAIDDLRNNKPTIFVDDSQSLSIDLIDESGIELMHIRLLEKFFGIEFEIITSSDYDSSLDALLSNNYDFVTDNIYDSNYLDFIDYATTPYFHETVAIATNIKQSFLDYDRVKQDEIYVSSDSNFVSLLEGTGFDNLTEVNKNIFVGGYRVGRFETLVGTLNYFYSNLTYNDGYIYPINEIVPDIPKRIASTKNSYREALKAFSKAYSYGINKSIQEYQYELHRSISREFYMDSLTSAERVYLLSLKDFTYSGFEFSPYFVEGEEEIDGLIVDLLNHFATNNEINSIYVPADELTEPMQDALNNGLVDVYVTEMSNLETYQTDEFIMVGPYYQDKYVVITTIDNENELSSLTELYYKPLGFLADDYYQDFFIDKAFPNAPFIHYFNDLDRLFNSLERFEIEYAILPYTWYIDYSLNNQDIDSKVAYLIEDGKSLNAYLKFPKTDEGYLLSSLFEKYFRYVYIDDVISQWETRYDSDNLLFEHNEQIKQSQTYTRTFLLYSLIFIGLLVGWYFRFRFTKLNHLIQYDDLTETLNRKSLIEHVMKGKPGVFLEINLHNLKEYNDLFGEEFGDLLIKNIATILKESFKEYYIFKYSGNEFYLLKYNEYKQSNQELTFLGFKVQRVLSKKLLVNKQIISVDFSVGIHAFDENEVSIKEMMKKSKIASDFSLKQGLNRFEICDLDLTKQHNTHLELEQVFKEDLRKGKVIAYYQPLIDTKTEKVSGFEALCRWDHEEGMIYPNVFLPIASKYRLMKEVDFHVLSQSLEFYKELLAENLITQEFTVSVNLSEYTLRKLDIEELVKLVSRYSVPHSIIQFEIIENISLNDELLKKINKLHQHQFRLSMDDFSAGYTSLNQISNLKLEKIKLDRLILPVDFEDELVTHLIYKRLVKLIHGLGLSTLAEGVETREQVLFLKENNVNYIQGYYYSKPISKHDFKEYIEGSDKND
jgi:diguanylate cyclase (GGDEF)-like protein